jgi:hypothetical protein
MLTLAPSIRSSPFPVHWLKPVAPFPFPFPLFPCVWLVEARSDPTLSRSMHAWYVGWVYRLLNLVENKSVLLKESRLFSSSFPLMVMNPKETQICAVLFLSVKALRVLS